MGASCRLRQILVGRPKPGKLRPRNIIAIPKVPLNRVRISPNPDAGVHARTRAPSQTIARTPTKPASRAQVDGRRRRLGRHVQNRQIQGTIDKAGFPDSALGLNADQGSNAGTPVHGRFITGERRRAADAQVPEIVRVGTFIEEELGFFADILGDGEMPEHHRLLALFGAEGNSSLLVMRSAARWHLGCYRPTL